MSADTKGKKRKSGDNVVPAAKKAKTSAPKSAPEPEAVKPLKSALKKTKPDPAVAPAKKPTKSIAVPANPPKDEVALAKTETKKAAKPAKSKAFKSEPKAAEAETVADEEEDDNETELTADQTAALLAGFSSDEEEEEDQGIDIATLPAPPVPAKDKKKRNSKGAAPEDDTENTPGTIYIGRLPHGFFERQLRAYYSQFGTIKNLRLARNKRTGKSQHHAFIEFASGAVADIVVKTMDKYLLFGHIMQVRRVPAEAVNEKMWKAGRSVKGGRIMPRNRIERSHLRRGAEREKWEQRVEREENRRKEKSEKLKELGYEFEMPKVKKVSSVPVQPKAIEAGETVVEETVESKVTVDENGPAVVEETTTVVEEEESGVVTTTVKKTVKRKTKAAEAPAAKKSKKAKTASAV